jgi:hypothetical protein
MLRDMGSALCSPLHRRTFRQLLLSVLSLHSVFSQAVRVEAPSADETCYPLDQIIDALTNSKDRNKPAPSESTLVERFKRRTVCSRPSLDDLNRIRRAGASARLIDALEAASPVGVIPTPTTPACPDLKPADPKPGRLTVTCAPVDCLVLVNGNPVGTTKQRVLSQELRPGPIVATVAAKDYEPDPVLATITVKEDGSHILAFTLNPTRASLEEAGAHLFTQMVAALRGKHDSDQETLLRFHGTLTIFHHGEPTVWNLLSLVKQPDMGRYYLESFQGGRQAYEAVRRGGAFDWIKTGRTPAFDELVFVLHRLQEYQLSEVVRRLQSSSFKIRSTEIQRSTHDDTLRASNGGETYRITLDSHLLPREIVLESGGFDEGIRLQYSDYTQAGSEFIPRRFEAEFRGSTADGFHVHFDRVEVNPPDVKDSIFLPKKGKRR